VAEAAKRASEEQIGPVLSTTKEDSVEERRRRAELLAQAAEK
jgi:hypothetical protein